MKRENSFDTMRLLGAAIVLVGHAYMIGGHGLWLSSMPFHHLGICIFFAISGYLITGSWIGDSDIARFLRKRALRIFPALVVVAFATAFIIGPMATEIGSHAYFASPETYKYALFNSIMVTTWSLPGVFEHLPIHYQVNGSLWSLPIEFSLYLLTPFVVAAARRIGPMAGYALAGLAIMVAAAQPFAPHLFSLSPHGINVGWGLAAAPFFWCGAACTLLRLESWSTKTKATAVVASIAVLAIWFALSPTYRVLGFLDVAPITILTLLAGLSTRFRLGKVEDISYGLYLWAFPIQQLVMLRTEGGPLAILAYATPVIIVLAFASWRLVERPALRLKPGRKAPGTTISVTTELAIEAVA